VAGSPTGVANGGPVTTLSAGGVRRSGRPVLVAEDNPVNQLVAVRMLEKRGFTVEVAANGREALRMYRPGRYAAIFMDCQMPELDGYEATGEIRRSEGTAHHTPIIAMTANTMRGDRDRCLAAGMDDYVGKPVRPAMLDDVIARALAIRDDSDSSEAREPERDQLAEPSDAAAAGHAPLLDHSMLAEIAQGDDQVRSELVCLFLDQSRAEVEQLAGAVAAADGETMQTVAHRLKGSSAVIGAQRLAEISNQLCEAARTGRLSDAPRLQGELERSFALTLGALGAAEEVAPVSSIRSSGR
jgi:two-component system sensor histidine kinase/response regulator